MCFSRFCLFNQNQIPIFLMLEHKLLREGAANLAVQYLAIKAIIYEFKSTQRGSEIRKSNKNCIIAWIHLQGKVQEVLLRKCVFGYGLSIK
ncbi:hypothetical protein pb186bvf_016895 [Paramecium bursaria]